MRSANRKAESKETRRKLHLDLSSMTDRVTPHFQAKREQIRALQARLIHQNEVDVNLNVSILPSIWSEKGQDAPDNERHQGQY